MISRRARSVESFKVMEVLRRATALEAQGRKIYHLEVGQPSTGAPASARRAAETALAANAPMGYTTANGLDALRCRVARWYDEKHGSRVAPERVVVTTGSSGGFVLAFSALFDPGDAVAVPSTAYPCYRNALRAVACEPVEITSSTLTFLPGLDDDDEKRGARAGFAFPSAEDVARLVDDRAKRGLSPVRGLVLSSPANPTGATLDDAALASVAAACADLGVRFISDEIYHHIEYDADAMTTTTRKPRASAVDLAGAVVVNSFSKYFSMTGWRVGWLVLPKDEQHALANDDGAGPELFATGVETLQQNLAICAPHVSQVAATASFDDADTELADHVARYAANRALVLDGLKRLGVDDAHVAPATGAFYCYADLGNYGVHDAAGFCERLLDDTGVAITPGLDFEFDPRVGRRRVRLSYCGDGLDVAEAMDKLHTWWPSRPTES